KAGRKSPISYSDPYVHSVSQPLVGQEIVRRHRCFQEVHIVRGNGLASGDSLSNLDPDVLHVNHQVTVGPQNLAHEMNEAGISLYIDVRKAARHLFKLASAKSFGHSQAESLPNFLLGIPR